MSWVDPRSGGLFVSRWNTCKDCDSRYQRWGPGSGYTRRSDGAVYGESYCRQCQYKRATASHKRLTGVMTTCPACGEEWELNVQQKSDMKHGRMVGFCSTKCLYDTSRIYPVNPGGDGLCRAPVPGGCNRDRKPTGPGCFGSLCNAHDKRRQRGSAIDTPVNERHSRSVKAGLR